MLLYQEQGSAGKTVRISWKWSAASSVESIGKSAPNGFMSEMNRMSAGGPKDDATVDRRLTYKEPFPGQWRSEKKKSVRPSAPSWPRCM
jgi:hypothetical protein